MFVQCRSFIYHNNVECSYYILSIIFGILFFTE